MAIGAPLAKGERILRRKSDTKFLIQALSFLLTLVIIGFVIYLYIN